MSLGEGGGAYERFSGGFLISINLPATDLKYLIRNLIFNSLKFELIAFKQCLPLLTIPMIWNHLAVALVTILPWLQQCI